MCGFSCRIDSTVSAQGMCSLLPIDCDKGTFLIGMDRRQADWTVIPFPPQHKIPINEVERN
jgi:hypothetical protein